MSASRQSSSDSEVAGAIAEKIAQPFDWEEIDRALSAQSDLGLRVDRPWTERCARAIAEGRLSPQSNRLARAPEPAGEDEIDALEAVPPGDVRELEERGRRALAQGKVASVVLNGGMATRFGGVVKGVVPALGTRSFLELKMHQALGAGAAAFLTMNSFATHAGTCALFEALPATAGAGASSPSPWVRAFGDRVRCFLQSAALRLSASGAPFRDRRGALSFYAPGHGEFVHALRRSGELRRLQESGVELLALSNVDNLGADLDPLLIGYHLQRERPLTCEVARTVPGDKGGSPCRVDSALEIVEGFRFPESFDWTRIHFLCTNSFLFTLDALEGTRPLRDYYVEKSVDGLPAVQIESVVNELTQQLPSSFLAVPRAGARGRFFPVKAPADLESLRSDPDLARRFPG